MKTLIVKTLILSGLSLLLVGWGSANADEYHLVAKHSGKCFNVFGGGTRNVTQVGQWDCGNGDNDNFILKDAGNGYYTVSPAHAKNMCLDIDWNRRTASGVSLVIYSCHGNENQQFQLRDMGDGYFQIVSRPGGKCLDVAGANKDNGAAIHTWDCKAGWDPGRDNQLFRKVLVKEDRMAASSGSPYNAIPRPARGEPVNLMSVHSGWCADVRFNGGQGSPLIMYKCHGGENQQFRFERDGTIRVKGLCVDAFGGSGNRGDTIGVWPCHGNTNQKWRVTREGEIRGINNRCIDVSGASTLPWANLILWDCHGGTTQKWWALRVFNPANPSQRVGHYSLNNGEQTAVPPELLGDKGAALIGNTGAAFLPPGNAFTMPIGNNLANVTPLTQVAP